MRAPDQNVSSHVLKQGVGFEAPSVFIYLSRVAVAELRIVGLKMSAYFLARLLEAEGAVGLGDTKNPIHRNKNVFVSFRHASNGCRGANRRSRHRRRCARSWAALH